MWRCRIGRAIAGLRVLLTAGLVGIASNAGAAPGSEPAAAMAPAAPATEYEQKARILVAMAKLAQWTDDVLISPTTPIELCIIGKDPFGNAFLVHERGQVQGHPFRARRLASIEEADNCAVVFIARSEATRVKRYLQALAGRPVITASETEGFVDAGGTVEFVSTGATVQFNLNRCAGSPSARPYLPTSNIRAAHNYGDSCKGEPRPSPHALP